MLYSSPWKPPPSKTLGAGYRGVRMKICGTCVFLETRSRAGNPFRPSLLLGKAVSACHRPGLISPEQNSPVQGNADLYEQADARRRWTLPAGGVRVGACVPVKAALSEIRPCQTACAYESLRWLFSPSHREGLFDVC